MKQFVKTLCVSLLLVIFLTGTLAGCAPKAATSQPAEDGSSVASEASSEAGEIDLSEHADLKMYLLGDPAAKLDVVLEEINKLAAEDLNASLSIDYIGWGDMDTKYSLILASGENVDLMFTGDWSYYAEEALKGAWLELTEDMLKTYMPGTYEAWEPAAWNHVMIDGKIYGVPNNLVQYTSVPAAVAIRGDLREKYGIEPLKTLDDLKNYWITIAQNEPSITANVCTVNNYFVKTISLFQCNDIVAMSGENSVQFVFKYEDGKEFTSDQLQYNYFIPEYIEWAKDMKELADAGVWSRDSASSTLQNQEAFEAGQSATGIQHFKSILQSAAKMDKEHPEWKSEVYNLFPDNIKTTAKFSNDMMAIPAVTKYPERAMMLLDKLNSDQTYYDLMQYGIEGVHWIDEGDNKFSEGPSWDDYRNGQNGQWGMQNQNFYKINVNEDPRTLEFTEQYDAKVVHPAPEGFRFNETNVKNEMAAVRAVEEQYGYLIDLGLVDDVDAAFEEFKAELEKAGIDKIITEYRTQLDAFLAAQG